MRDYNRVWIAFLSHTNVVKVTNKNEFNQFRSFLNECGLIEYLQDDTTFESWQKLAIINNKKTDMFLFEYDNYKGLTWDDNIEESIKWYGEEPIDVSELQEFFDKKSYKIFDKDTEGLVQLIYLPDERDAKVFVNIDNKFIGVFNSIDEVQEYFKNAKYYLGFYQEYMSETGYVIEKYAIFELEKNKKIDLNNTKKEIDFDYT